MSSPGGVVAGLLGSAASNAAAFAAGIAIGPTLAPEVQILVNEAWSLAPVRPPTIYTTARGVAEGKINEGDARQWAHEQGFNDTVFDALVAASKGAADFANLMAGWRRGLINDTEFQLGLDRLGFEPEWYPLLKGLKREYLTPAEAANARQQEFISPAEQVAIAGRFGIEPADAEVQFELAGLPPGVETGLRLWRRGIIDQATFDRIVAEGHTKTKYTPALEQLRRELLSAATAVRAHLKGHIDVNEMHSRGADWGYTPADMDLWYEAEGRPATPHQIHIGYRRGADVQGLSEQAAIDAAVAQSDVRPEYRAVLYAGRDTFPSLFQLNRLVQANAISPATAADWADKAGVNAGVVSVLEQYWQTLGGGSVADPHVTKADSQLWTTLHRAYLGSVVDDAHVQNGLNLIGVPSAAHAEILARWTFERDLERRRLTPAQVKKAYGEGAINHATGAAWTQADAIAYLIELGYSAADARSFLEI